MKKNNIIRLSSIVGVLLFVLIVYKIGPDQIWQNIKKITLQYFVILLFLRLFYWLLRTYCWKLILDGYGCRRPFFHLFAARMGCHAISQLTPSANLGGEAARVMMLNSSKRVSLASVIVDKTLEFLTVIFFTFVAVVIVISRISMPGRYKFFFVAFVLSASGLLLFLVSKQKKGFLGWIIKLLAKIKVKFKILEKNKEKIEQTDEYISEFYREHRKIFAKICFFYSLLILFWTLEIHLTLVFIGAQVTILDSFLVVSLGTLAFVFPVVPASLGVYEATYVGIFALLRLGTDVGLTLVLIRRLIALIWAGIGLFGIMSLKQPSKREQEQ